MSETESLRAVLTPETLRYMDHAHENSCQRYMRGLYNTQAIDCNCQLGMHADAWAADKARLEAAERDMARYRFLRHDPYWPEEQMLREGEDLDAAIDAAIAAGFERPQDIR